MKNSRLKARSFLIGGLFCSPDGGKKSPAQPDKGERLRKPCIGPSSQPKLALRLPIKGPTF